MSKLDPVWIMDEWKKHEDVSLIDFARAIEKEVRKVALNDAAIAADTVRSTFAGSGFIRQAAGAWAAHEEIREMAEKGE